MSDATDRQVDKHVSHLPALLFLPAMGVARAYYGPFVEQLEHLGYPVTVADFDMSTHSGVGAPLDGYAELVERRIRDGIDTASQVTGTGRIVVLGHSLGGQLALIFAGRFAPEVPVILIGSGTAHFRGFPVPRRWLYLIASQVIGGVASILRVWPGDKFGFGGRQTALTMHDWARNVRTGRYRSQDASFDYEAALNSYRGPVAVIDVEGDVFAPPASSTRLTELSSAVVVRRETYVAARGRRKPGAHFTWARDAPGVAPLIVQLLSTPEFTGHRVGEVEEPR